MGKVATKTRHTGTRRFLEFVLSKIKDLTPVIQLKTVFTQFLFQRQFDYLVETNKDNSV